MKKITTMLIMTLVLALGLTACGGDSEDASEETTEATEATDATEEETEEESEEESEEAEDDQASGEEINVISREDGSGTRSAFTEITGVAEDGEDKTWIDAVVQNSTDAVMTTVSQDPAAIGYISLGSLNDSVKALKVEGVEATVENIKSDDYKIARPFNIAYQEAELSDLAKDFIDYILSEEGQKIIEENGYISVSDEAPAYEGSEMEGSLTLGGSTSVAPVMEKIAEAYKEVNPDVEINIEATGSSAGVTGAANGTLDIGMSSRDLKDEEKETVDSEKIALDGIAVIVNNDQEADDISLDTIKAVFTGEERSWSGVK